MKPKKQPSSESIDEGHRSGDNLSVEWGEDLEHLLNDESPLDRCKGPGCTTTYDKP